MISFQKRARLKLDEKRFFFFEGGKFQTHERFNMLKSHKINFVFSISQTFYVITQLGGNNLYNFEPFVIFCQPTTAV